MIFEYVCMTRRMPSCPSTMNAMLMWSFGGFYAIAIGSIDPLDPAIFMRANVWVGITIDNQAEMRPRTRLLKVPAAFTASRGRCAW